MAKPYTINITNGTGTENVLNGNYTVTANVEGYENTTIDPKTLTIAEGTNTYELTIEASGTLTLHVTDDGTTTGNPIEGAKFYRTTSTGTQIGTELTTDSNGNVTIEHLPYSSNITLTTYYIQTSSDGEHEFDNTMQSIALTQSATTVEIANTPAVERTFLLKDNYAEEIEIPSATITLN